MTVRPGASPEAQGTAALGAATQEPSAAFTAGPWRFGEWWDAHGRKSPNKRGLLYAVHADQDYGSRGLVVNVGIKGGEVDDYWLSVSDANARLIAAAPDGYAAAKDALAGWRYIRSHYGDLYGVGWDRVEKALADFIAKAEGKP